MLLRVVYGTKSQLFIFFFFNDTATTEIYTLSLHDALPISIVGRFILMFLPDPAATLRALASQLRPGGLIASARRVDRKSTRLNSSHTVISYAVFCLKKKKKSMEFCRGKIRRRNSPSWSRAP